MGRQKLEKPLSNAERKRKWREENKEKEKEDDRIRKAEKRKKYTDIEEHELKEKTYCINKNLGRNCIKQSPNRRKREGYYKTETERKGSMKRRKNPQRLYHHSHKKKR